VRLEVDKTSQTPYSARLRDSKLSLDETLFIKDVANVSAGRAGSGSSAIIVTRDGRVRETSLALQDKGTKLADVKAPGAATIVYATGANARGSVSVQNVFRANNSNIVAAPSGFVRAADARALQRAFHLPSLGGDVLANFFKGAREVASATFSPILATLAHPAILAQLTLRTDILPRAFLLPPRKLIKETALTISLLLTTAVEFGRSFARAAASPMPVLGAINHRLATTAHNIRAVGIDDAHPLLGVDLFRSGFELKQLVMNNRAGFLATMGQALRLLSVVTGKPVNQNQFNSMVQSFVLRYQHDAAANQPWFDNAFAAVVIEPYSHSPQIALIGQNGLMWTPNSGFTQLIMNDVPAARQNPIVGMNNNLNNPAQMQNIKPVQLHSFAAEEKSAAPKFAIANVPASVEAAGVIVNGEIKMFSGAAGETEINISEESFAQVKGTFVPFHTHLGHPSSFHGVARFAPSAEDVLAHRYLMTKYAKTNGTSLDVPGVIFHASGEITLFWAPANDAGAVRFSVIYPSGARETALTTMEHLALAAETGELNLNVAGVGSMRTTQRLSRAIDLWDPKLKEVL
jgi:hypothetical protein